MILVKVDYKVDELHNKGQMSIEITICVIYTCVRIWYIFQKKIESVLMGKKLCWQSNFHSKRI